MINIHDDDLNDDNEKNPTACCWRNRESKEPKRDDGQITAQGFTHEQPKDLYYLQASSILGLPESAYNYYMNRF